VLRRQAVPLTATAFLTVQIALGIPVVAPFYLIEISQVGLQLPTLQNAWVFLTVAVGPGLLAYAFWNNGVRTIGASRAALFLYLIPVFAAILGGIFLGERLAAFHAFGGALILAGLLLASRSRRGGSGTGP
jgi:drug/metabolite transporter (DMT)-like permease